MALSVYMHDKHTYMYMIFKYVKKAARLEEKSAHIISGKVCSYLLVCA